MKIVRPYTVIANKLVNDILLIVERGLAIDYVLINDAELFLGYWSKSPKAA